MTLWVIMAVSVFYVLFFALASLLPRNLRTRKSGLQYSDFRPQTTDHSPQASNLSTFLVLYPAYHEDAVIRTSIEKFIKQDYPSDHYQVVVISDHMTDETNAWLAKLPITLLTPQFDKSSKARALQFAVHSLTTIRFSLLAINYVVILDADNVVAPDFLSHLNAECQKGYHAIQCHRTAKNSDNSIAALDGLSEEINNSIFRRGHNRVGLSSALIGSGMCFDYEWFKNNVDQLDSAVEDRELEALLMRQDIFINYAENILVMDEKVSNSDNFQRQRLRWMTGQVQALVRMLPYIPKAIATANINYIDKTLQQALIPRSLLLVLPPLFAVICSAMSCGAVANSTLYTLNSKLPALWWLLVLLLFLALFIAIPPRLRTTALLHKALTLPALVWRMLKNLLHIRPKNKEFIHTAHNQ